MHILAGSLNVEVSEFLHAGYLSAYPRSFEVMGRNRFLSTETKVIDVKKALELKPVEALPEAKTAQVETLPSALPPASMATDGFLLGAVFLFFACLVGIYVRRLRRGVKVTWRAWGLAGLLLTPLVVYWCLPRYEQEESIGEKDPWMPIDAWFKDDEKLPSDFQDDLVVTEPTEESVRRYQDPHAATEAILQGLIAPALAGCRFGVTNLAALQREVAFPVPANELTPGMVYALKYYGLDGWGRRFSVERGERESYRIISAGPDGVFGSQDDIQAETRIPVGDWEQAVNGLYLRVVRDSPVYFLHRVAHSNFRFAHAQEARDATETDQFDLLPAEELYPGIDAATVKAPLLAQLRRHVPARLSLGKARPLLFLQMEHAHGR